MAKKKKENKTAGFFIFLTLAAILLFFGFSKYINGKKTESWPSVEGTIISSKLNHRFVETKRGAKIEFIPEIKYVFYVDNIRYESTRISYKSTNGIIIIERYPEGRKANIYYNPKNHEISVLETGMDYYSIYLLLPFGFISLVIAILSLIVNLKRKI